MTTEKNPAARRKTLLVAASLFFIAAGLLYGAWWLLFASHYEETDNAYVHGNLVQVTTRIAGTVVQIAADETDTVKRGAPLIGLDPSDTRIALEQARGALAQAVRQTRTLFVQNQALEADIEVRNADIERARADLAKARNDLKRRQSLAGSGGVSGEEVLHARTAVTSAQSGLAQAEAALAVARARLDTNRALTVNTTVAGHPDVRMAADKYRQAWLAYSRASIPAPVEGMVARRAVQVGQHVAPGTPLMTLVPMDQLWVEANFKEGQLRRMKPGQRATLVADLYGSDVVYHGHVQGVAAGSGAAFSLLPAQNASGNWIKVVQRVPVRILLDAEELKQHPLRVGLSMQVEVDLSEPSEEDVLRVARAAEAHQLSTSVFDTGDAQAGAEIERIIQDNDAR